MTEFADEVAVLSRWLGQDVAPGLAGVTPSWNAFRFRDATVFAVESPELGRRMYLVRGQDVRELVVSQSTIDEAYALLDGGVALPAVA